MLEFGHFGIIITEKEIIMPSHQCPGMNPSSWRPSDINEHHCECGFSLEFWKDDIKRNCPKCGKLMINPNLGNLCLSWCDQAAECIGNMDIEDWKEKTQKVQKTEPEI